ncbi:DNA-binding MarR family transcriptional regulator [Sphingomonas insulae]|uniref:HTH marR-type domain-containing protein n=1 Tax=Sphingomonas insulae TaxID=424800 RepID=A0ABN1HZY0_9SPHN|nr:MarR family transcriptional regulator [Sphingomonas insulae]NIJ30582.1 DNA-binding MarR family transcriptional regulator [Sphingomonas insulae]
MPFYSDSNFHPDMSIGYLIRRSEQLGTAALEPVFAAHDISKTQWSALVALHFDRASTCAEIARDLGHDKGATTRLVDTLEERGWVTRARADGDRRLVRVTLTSSGGAIAIKVRDAVIDVWNDWLDGWNAQDVNDLIRLLGQLRDTMQQTFDESAPA